MVNFKELKVIQKYLYNRVNYDEFKKYLEVDIGTLLDDSYVQEKWQIFTRCHLQFILNECTSTFLEAVQVDIDELDYKG